MRILMVVNTLPPFDLSGAGEQVVQLAWSLRSAGHQVELLGRGPLGARGPKVLFPITVLWPLWRALRQQAPLVVQLHESDGGLAALALRCLPRARRPRVVALQQVSYREERRAVRALRDRGAPGAPVLAEPVAVERRFRRYRTPFHIVLGMLTARCADRVLAPCAATCAELERDYGARGCRVVANTTGAPLAEPAPASGTDHPSSGTDHPSSGTDQHPSVPLPAPGEPFLLFVGRLRIRKGVEVLLHALAAIARADGAAPLLLIAGDGERRDALTRSSAALGLGERVRFLGTCDRGQVASLMGAASALVVPSIYEGMPLVILEAMRRGCPVIASRVSGIPELVDDPATGWLVPPEDTTALAAALRAAADRAEAKRRAAAAREQWRLRFAPEHAAAAWLRAIAP